MTDELTTWLRAQIAGDEEAARKRMHHAQQNHLLLQDPAYWGRFIPGWYEWPEIEAAAAHGLAVCEVHTRIIDEVVPRIDEMDDKIEQEWGSSETGPHEESVLILKLLASAYQHRSGYREEWRP